METETETELEDIWEESDAVQKEPNEGEDIAGLTIRSLLRIGEFFMGTLLSFLLPYIRRPQSKVWLRRSQSNMAKPSVTTRARIDYALLLPRYEANQGIPTSKTRRKKRRGVTCRDEHRSVAF